MAVVSTRRAASVVVPIGAIAALLTFCAFLAMLVAAHDRPAAHLSRTVAETAALRDPVVREHLARHRYDRVRTMALDDSETRISFFDGPRIVLEAAVARGGRVSSLIRYDDAYVRAGSEVGQTPLVLGMLTSLFLLAMLRLPLRRIENLDALALAAFSVPIVLLNERLLEWSVLPSSALLAYLVVRCVRVALAPRGERSQVVWLVERLPRRALAASTVAAALALTAGSIPGGLVSDVGYASMTGATSLLHGALPYGNLAQGELVHGDTYPLLAYLVYVPAALATPVRHGFDQLDGALWTATGFALVAALTLAGAARSGGRGDLRLALAFLAFPPVMLATSSGSNDLVAAVCVAAALASAARPGRSSAALAAAGSVKLAPFALLPLWLARHRSWRAVGAGALPALLVAALAIALGGIDGVGRMVDSVSFQTQRGSLLSPWAMLGAGGAQVAFQAAVLTGLALGCARVWRDRALAADPRRMAALGAAVMLAVQLAANYWSCAYLVWAFPLLAVGLFSEAPRRVTA
jgi:glycosyl transferase family 87